MEALRNIGDGLLVLASLWVGWACIRRINLMRWGQHQCLQVAAYILIALWAAVELLGLWEFDFVGIIGVAMLFWGGRKRWLTRAPEDTEREPTAAALQLRAALRTSMLLDRDVNRAAGERARDLDRTRP